MWNSMKSVKLSSVCTRIVMALVVICVALLPQVMGSWYIGYPDTYMDGGDIRIFIGMMYACCVPAMAALICLDRLLVNIRKGEVFILRNVKLLRAISWCCFAAAVLLVSAVVYYRLFALMAVAVAFVGLILRVVKNVIEEAVQIKQENDFTI